MRTGWQSSRRWAVRATQAIWRSAFLITSEWVLGEAAARGISVSEAEVKQRLAQTEKQSFPKAGALEKFLAKSGETEADLLARIKVEMLESRIAAKVTAGKSGSQSKALIASFETALPAPLEELHDLQAGLCDGRLLGVQGQARRPHRHELLLAQLQLGLLRLLLELLELQLIHSSSSNSSGEVPPPPRVPMSISSSAFELNGAIPTAIHVRRRWYQPTA